MNAEHQQCNCLWKNPPCDRPGAYPKNLHKAGSKVYRRSGIS